MTIESLDSIENQNELLLTDVESNVEGICANDTVDNTEDSLSSFEWIEYPDPNEIQIAGFNKEKLLQMCTFSKMTYGNDDAKLLQTGYETRGSFISKGYSVIPFYYSSGRQAGFVFIKDREITIAYCGTQDFADIVIDVCAMLVPLKFLSEGGRAHCGFYYSFCDSQDSLRCILDNYAKEQKLGIKDFKFYHSMGGAIAKIAALFLSKVIGVQDLYVATFADPRVFDLTAGESYNRALLNRIVRVTQHGYDPVPAVAPGLFGYVHVGEQLRIPIASWLTIHKIDSYYQAINTIRESDFQSNNSKSIFYYLVRVFITQNGITLGNAQYYIANFFGYYSYQNILPIDFYREEDFEIIPYEGRSISMIAPNPLNYTHVNTQQLSVSKICELGGSNWAIGVMSFQLSDSISTLDFSAKVSVSIKNNNPVKEVIKLVTDGKKMLALLAEIRNGNAIKQNLNLPEQQQNSLFIQESDLSNKSLKFGNAAAFNEVRQTINAYNEDGFTLVTESGVTPLHEAAYVGYIDIMRSLLEHSATIDAKDRHNFTPLQYACSNGKLETVKLLLKKKVDPYFQNNNGETTLFHAVDSGRLEIVSTLISTVEDKRKYINTQNNSGKTVLHIVACKQEINRAHKEVVKLLLKNGANLYLRDKRGQSALDIAKEQNNEEFISLFSPQNTEKSELPIIAASTLSTIGVTLGIVISIYLKMLAIGVTVRVCLIISAAAVLSYHYNSQATSPKSSLEVASNISCIKDNNTIPQVL